MKPRVRGKLRGSVSSDFGALMPHELPKSGEAVWKRTHGLASVSTRP